MSRLQVTRNHPATLPFIDAVGKLIVNMGFVEALTFSIIEALQTDKLLYEYAKRLTLSDRIQMVVSLVEKRAPLDALGKTELISALKALKPHMERRNTVAHSPIMFSADAEASPKSVTRIGVLNLKPKDKSRDAELVSLPEIVASVDATAKLAEHIDVAYKKIMAELKGRDT